MVVVVVVVVDVCARPANSSNSRFLTSALSDRGHCCRSFPHHPSCQPRKPGERPDTGGRTYGTCSCISTEIWSCRVCGQVRFLGSKTACTDPPTPPGRRSFNIIASPRALLDSPSWTKSRCAERGHRTRPSSHTVPRNNPCLTSASLVAKEVSALPH
ncbi:hypothetical protein GQ44DRAFT_92421 [Phaeosphaeriaceae sp. PMI808]|nr:hypothetical protein GQ44DRAFT_92421 [Phaeosphaeriaceae sp. PMI808]